MSMPRDRPNEGFSTRYAAVEMTNLWGCRSVLPLSRRRILEPHDELDSSGRMVGLT